MTADERRQSTPRVDFESEVQIDFPDFGEFIREYSTNVSVGGMFIKTRLPFEPGHEFTFCFVAGGDVPVISGRAVVIWCRKQAVSPMAEAGMGVRFLELEGRSKALIERIVECGQDGRPFELTDIPQVKF